ncbi:MAG: hypoxanthine phosphoribosyltransferase [Archaeoglobaceae archaeon]
MELELLISRNDIRNRVREIAQQIDRDYEGKNPVLICILKGSVIFLSDLVRDLNVMVEIEFMEVKSYVGMKNHEPEVKLDINRELKGKDLIIVEDIVDTGLTTSSLKDILLPREPKSLKICTFLDKPDRRKVDIKADYVGFEIPDVFVVGYGLDVDGKYRQLADIHYVSGTNVSE